jgi:hypothetical protein
MAGGKLQPINGEIECEAPRSKPRGASHLRNLFSFYPCPLADLTARPWGLRSLRIFNAIPAEFRRGRQVYRRAYYQTHTPRMRVSVSLSTLPISKPWAI